MQRNERGLVVVVEDERPLREAIVRRLAFAGYSVVGAEDGQAGLDLIASEPGPYFALLVDLFMPRKRGDELIYALDSQAVSFSAYVIISGQSSEHPLLQTLQSHRSGAPLYFFPKPFNADDLVELLDGIPAVQAKGISP